MDVGGEEAFEFAQVLVGGAEERENGFGGELDAGTDGPCCGARTIACTDAGHGVGRVADLTMGSQK
ncbi:Uncharacterised protein [Mycobacteroides abscessus subsp. abscessus]|nr:Uncharacterised protein [Mycobacteroides abscessus subsp. abscessus]